MPPVTFERWRLWNEQLASLARAGAPLALEADEFEPITTALARWIDRGHSLADALDAERATLPPSYFAAAQQALATGDFSQATDEHLLPSPAVAPLRRITRHTWGYPLFILTLALAGLVLWLGVTAPVVAEQYESLRTTPPTWLAWLLALRRLGWLAVLAPVGVGVLGWAALKRKRRAGGWLLGKKGWEQVHPLTQWAESEQVSAAERPAALALACESRQRQVRGRAEQLRRWAPLAACVLVAGGAVLAYGLVVFGPVIDLLATLAKPS